MKIAFNLQYPNISKQYIEQTFPQDPFQLQVVLSKIVQLLLRKLGKLTKTRNTVFSKCTRMAIMPILASEALFHENKKFQLQNATLVSIEPLDLWFQVQHAPLYTNLAFACKTKTLSSLHAYIVMPYWF